MKKQIKKGLSLMMAVLMVLSCWVWVAPTKAEAANPGKYYVEVKWYANSTEQKNGPQWDEDGDGSSIGIKIDYVSNNGTGDTSSITESFVGKAEKTDNISSFTLDGFPVKLHAELDGGSIFASDKLYIKEMKVGPDSSHMTTILNRTIELNSSTECKYFWVDYTGKSYSNDSRNAKFTGASTQKYSWDLPILTNNFSATNPTEITIPTIGSTTINKVDIPAFSFTDQYGVERYQGNGGFVLTTTTGAATPLDDTETVAYLENNKVCIAADFQDTYRLAANEKYKDYYVNALGENGKTVIASQLIRVNYPTYDYAFNVDYNTSASDAATEINYKDGTTYTGSVNGSINSDLKKAYGQSIANPPVGATKTGYEFLGFWTTPQPSSGSASPYELKAKAQSPVSSETYKALDDETKKSYVDAGTQWDSTNSEMVTCSGNKTYYAWFIAKDVSVKFFSIDGTYIKEIVKKYGQQIAQNEFPTVGVDFPETYQSGPFSYAGFTGNWIDSDGSSINYNTKFTKDAYLLRPDYGTVNYTKDYTVTFYQGSAGNTISQNKYEYGAANVTVPTANEACKVPSDAQYDYEFAGWSTVVPEGTDKRHIIREDADVILGTSTPVYLVGEYTVRSDANYYPVYRAKTRSYDVKFMYRVVTADGGIKYDTKTATFKYGENIVVPEGIPTEYATQGKEYKQTGWDYKLGQTEVKNIQSNLRGQTCNGAGTYSMVYDQGTNVPYNVTFISRNDKGEQISQIVKVNHGENIPTETIDALISSKTYDDGDSLYTFDGTWVCSVDDGQMTIDDLKAYSPISHVTFTANYANPKKFHIVTYIDGANEKSYRVVDGDILPEWTVIESQSVKDDEGNETTKDVEVPYEPSKASTQEGQYIFMGWAGAQQTDEQIASGTLAGAKVTPKTDKVTSDLTLYSQYKFSQFIYVIKFVSYDGKDVIAQANLHYGDPLANVLNAAEAGAQGTNKKPSDDTYYYEFIGWDKEVPNRCEGGDPDVELVFTAQYQARYNYYYVNWYNTNAKGEIVNKDGTAVAEGEKATVIETGTYIYGDKIHTPSEDFTAPANDADGSKYVLSGWEYQAKDGSWQTFTRNLKIDKDNFYGDIADGINMRAVYKKATQYWTVNVVIDEKDTSKNYTLTVENGDTIENLITEPASGYVNETYHNGFKCWMIGDKEFEVTTPITENITVKAEFVNEEHSFTLSEVVTAPTYPMASYTDFNGTLVKEKDGKGQRLLWCACSKTADGAHKYEEIPALTDKIAPTATTYIGTAKWTDIAGAYGADTVFASPNTDIIITTGDLGDVNADFNPTGKGIGVQTIKMVIVDAEGLATAGQEGMIAYITSAIASGEAKFETVYDWTEIQKALIQNYGGWAKVPAQYKDYNANFSAQLSDFDLENGKTYVALYVVTDKANNSGYAMSGKFYYDDVAPVITVEGKSNAAKDTYCGSAIVTVNESSNDYTVTDNDIVMSSSDGKYIVSAAGQHKIVATDKAGNTTTVYFNVNTGHTFATFTQNPTCTAEGHTSQRCIICGTETDTVKIDPLGHEHDITTVQATCTENGYIVKKCTRCGDVQKLVYKTDDNGNATQEYLLPAKGHDFDSGTVTVTKKATCVEKGEKVTICANGCGEKKTEEIAIDNTAHSFGSAYIIKSTCTEDGYRKHKCRYCGEVETIETIAATGHTKSDEYKVIKEATCTEEGTKIITCKTCGVTIEGTETTIPKVDHHWVKDDANCVEPTVGKKGVLAFKCDNESCSATYTKDIDELTESTVVFIGEDDKEIKKITLVDGSSISEGDNEEIGKIANPTKASTEKYDYNFMGWYTKDDKGNYDTKYTLPMVVEKDLTLYARFSEDAIIKTLVFQVPTSYDKETGEFTNNMTSKTLIGTVGDKNRIPAEVPTFRDDAYTSFTFDYWEAANGDKFDGTVTDNGTYTAVFKTETNKYDVLFMLDTTTLHGSVEVTAGDDVDMTAIAAPKKASDNDYHYTFCGWYTKPGCTSTDAKNKVTSLDDITEKTVVYAGFDPTAHAHDTEVKPVVTQKKSCTADEITEYTCTCGYKWSEVTATATGHKEGEPTYNNETGKNEFHCTECGYLMRSEDASYTIKFVNWDNTALTANIKVVRNETFYAQAEVAQGKATRDPDDKFSYTFSGWALKGDDSKIYSSNELPAATANVTYVAQYTGTPRVYTVTFATSDNKTVESFTGIKYGETKDENGFDVTTYKYDSKLFPATKSDSKAHYVFDKWDKDLSSGVTGNTVVRPVFKAVEHSFGKGVTTGATCTEDGGTKYTCSVCGYSWTDNHNGKEPKLGHNYASQVIKQATFTETGIIRYTCQRPGCGDTYDETIPMKSYITITVTVKDTNGKTFEGAKVTITHKVSGKAYGPNLTNKDGVATFLVEEEGTYFVSIVEIPGHDGGNSGEITVDENGNVKDNTINDLKGENHSDCSCGCHRNGFWGAIFRFFHKIIKLFAGRYICCDCPDSRY